jgi:hypothetical protein
MVDQCIEIEPQGGGRFTRGQPADWDRVLSRMAGVRLLTDVDPPPGYTAYEVEQGGSLGGGRHCYLVLDAHAQGEIAEIDG